jgi:hypothetical protein
MRRGDYFTDVVPYTPDSLILQIQFSMRVH